MARRVLVTGGAGFIGSHVADVYLQHGWTVAVLDNLTHGSREYIPREASFEQLDVRSEDARTLMATGGFDILNHQAAQMDVRVSVANPTFDADTNILGLLNLLEGARAGGVRRVVFASSGGVVYGESGEPPFGEAAPKEPGSPYGVSKLAAEYYLTLYGQLHGLEIVSLRYANVYGPRQDPYGEAGVVAIFSERLRRDASLTIYGDGRQTRDYVYVGDVAKANLLATEVSLPRPTSVDTCAFNIGTGAETRVNDLATKLAAIAECQAKVTHAPARPGELQRSALRIGKAEDELGWRPEVPLQEGLKLTYAWFGED